MHDCEILAEIGANHCGDPHKAFELVRAAATAGADAVKFQRRTTRALYTREYLRRPYAGDHSYGATYGAHREALELSLAHLHDLKSYAHDLGLKFGCTAFDLPGLIDLRDLGVDFIKIASGDLRSLYLIQEAAGMGVPLVISTGGGLWGDVLRAVEAAADAHHVTVLHCTAAYPARYEDLNLSCIPQMRADLDANGWHGVDVGASLHVSGISAGLMAYMLGARMIEQHFTLDRASKGTDHGFSLEPQGLAKLVRDIRRAQVAMGDPLKQMLECEREPLAKMSKAIYAARALPVGATLWAGDLTFKCPGGVGISPADADKLIGRRLARSVMMDDLLTVDVLEPVEVPAWVS